MVCPQHKTAETGFYPEHRLEPLADSSVDLTLRVWTENANYWNLRWDLNKACKTAIEEAGLSIPFPQRDVHVVKP